MKRIRIYKEFKEFAVKGNFVDVGLGIVIGAAFTTIINSFVKDILTPISAVFTTHINYSNWFIVLKPSSSKETLKTLANAELDKAITLNIRTFIANVISFIIVSSFLFMLARGINKM